MGAADPRAQDHRRINAELPVVLLLLFEVTPRDGHVDEYLEIAAKLRPELDASGGCLFIDRYRSLARPRTLLSFQVWRDEAAVTRWRVHPEHQKAQAIGRARVFEDYRLRIAAINRDESIDGARSQPAHGNTRRAQSTRGRRFVGIADSLLASLAGAAESFESIYRPGQHAHLFAWTSHEQPPSLARIEGATRLRIGEIERDYGWADRAEAPQHLSPVAGPT
jgi:heme-degrading monooxygenase HmoA